MKDVNLRGLVASLRATERANFGPAGYLGGLFGPLDVEDDVVYRSFITDILEVVEHAEQGLPVFPAPKRQIQVRLDSHSDSGRDSLSG